MTKRPTRGWVYFVRSRDGIKIGFSTGPFDRIAALQTSHAYKLQLLGRMWGSPKLERALHRHFDDCRLQGEWFRPVPELLQYIERRTLEGQERSDKLREQTLNNLPTKKPNPLPPIVDELRRLRPRFAKQPEISTRIGHLLGQHSARANPESPAHAAALDAMIARTATELDRLAPQPETSQ